MKNLFISCLAFLLFGCTEKTDTKYVEMYEVINDIILKTYSDVDLVVLKLKSNQKDYTIYHPDSISIIQTSLSHKVLYSQNIFDCFIKRNMIDSIDVEFMYNQIDSLEICYLDSSRIEKKNIKTIYEIDNLDENLLKMNAHNFIEFSIPLLSKDKNKMFIELEYFEGRRSFRRTLYLYEMTDNKWREKGTLNKY
ncbi:MAG: hypothetical protein VB126_01105 [Paludibacter sp.]|nr:hypothetical protein [Paludibacter sp.]